MSMIYCVVLLLLLLTLDVLHIWWRLWDMVRFRVIVIVLFLLISCRCYRRCHFNSSGWVMNFGAEKPSTRIQMFLFLYKRITNEWIRKYSKRHTIDLICAILLRTTTSKHTWMQNHISAAERWNRAENKFKSL